MKASAAGEGEGGFIDEAAGGNDFLLSLFELLAVEHNQYGAVVGVRIQFGTKEAAFQPLFFNR